MEIINFLERIVFLYDINEKQYLISFFSGRFIRIFGVFLRKIKNIQHLSKCNLPAAFSKYNIFSFFSPLNGTGVSSHQRPTEIFTKYGANKQCNYF